MSEGGHELATTGVRRQPQPKPISRTPIVATVRSFLDRHKWCGELLLLAALYSVYELVRAFTESGMAQSFANGRNILRFEQSLHLAPEHALNSFFAAVPAVAIPACFLYATCHYVVTPTVMVWLWRAHPDQYRRVRSVLVVGTLVALIGFCLMPTAPPRLIGGFTDTMAHWSSIGWWGTAASVPDGLEGLTDQAGAMPSLHVGWALWCGWAIFRCARRSWVRALGIAYPVVTTLVVLGTANHYLADAVAGAAVMGLGMFVVAVIVRIQARHQAGRLIRSVGVNHRSAPEPTAADELLTRTSHRVAGQRGPDTAG